MTPFAKLLDAIPEVPTTAYRNAFYASPTINTRVHNLATGNIEMWDGSAWQTIFEGVTSGAGRVIFTGATAPNGAQVGSAGDAYVQQVSATVTLLWLKQSGTGTNTGWQALSATGTGSPESVVAAPIGVTYAQTDGATGNVTWVKNSGTGNTGWRLLSTSFGTFNVKDYGAKGDGVTDDTAAIAAALTAAEGGDVVLPPGVYLHSGLTIANAETRLIGSTSRWGTTPTNAPTVLQYTGAGTAITITGANVTLKGLQIGNTGTGTVGIQINGSYSLLEDVAVSPSVAFSTAGIAYSTSLTLFQSMRRVYVYGSPIGIDIPIGNSFRLQEVELVFPTSIGVRIGNTAQVIDCQMWGWAIDVGTGASTTAVGVQVLRCSTGSFRDGYIEVSEGVSEAGHLAVSLAAATSNAVSSFDISGCYLNGNTYANYAVAVSGPSTYVRLRGNNFRDFVTAGVNNINTTLGMANDNYIRGVTPAVLDSVTNWLGVADGSFQAQGTLGFKNATAFRFTLSGTPTVNRTITFPDATDTVLLLSQLQDPSFGIVSAARFKGRGTSHVAGDYALSAGWGTTATVSAVSAKDTGGRVTIASAGTGQLANPTVTLTWKDGTWTTVPAVTVSRGDLAAPSGNFQNTTPGATTIVFTFNGTPVAGNSYILDFVAMGK